MDVPWIMSFENMVILHGYAAILVYQRVAQTQLFMFFSMNIDRQDTDNWVLGLSELCGRKVCSSIPITLVGGLCLRHISIIGHNPRLYDLYDFVCISMADGW